MLARAFKIQRAYRTTAGSFSSDNTELDRKYFIEIKFRKIIL